MKFFKKFSLEMLLPVLFAWFMMTILVDIIAIPAVFRNIGNIRDAGKVGMMVFGRFNIIENIFAVIVFWGTFSFCESKKIKWPMTPAVYLFIMSWVYTFLMTPKITDLTHTMNRLEITDPNFEVLQLQHAQYHNLYRMMDSIKLFVLLGFVVWFLIVKLKVKKEGEI